MTKQDHIEPTAIICERDPEIPVCDICSRHRYLLVQKSGTYYIIHSDLLSPQTVRAIHIWKYRTKDPSCILALRPIKDTGAL